MHRGGRHSKIRKWHGRHRSGRTQAVTQVQSLRRRVDVSNGQRFELKLEYRPSPEEQESRYQVEAFVCLPARLNITPETLPLQQFYKDIHNYVRLKTPELSWLELQALPSSPLTRATAEAEELALGREPLAFDYECRLFANIFWAGLRRFAERVQVAAAGGNEEIARQSGDISETWRQIEATMAAYRALRPLACAPDAPKEASLTFKWVDEYISLAVEQLVKRAVVAIFRRTRAAETTSPLGEQLMGWILNEEAYRKAQQYPSVLDPQSDNESYVSRLGLLKRTCSSVLFLHIRRIATRGPWQEILFAVAAGIAMAFATVVAFWAQIQQLGTSMRLFVVLVLGYMFKDRLKDATKVFFSHVLDRYLYDRRIEIQDPAGGELGVFREKIQLVASKNLPKDAQAIRMLATDPMQKLLEENHETIYCYKKEIILRTSQLYGRRAGAGLTDIIRFRVTHWLKEMDDPYTDIDWVTLKDLTITPVRAAKVYPVDVVFRFRSRPKEPPVVSLIRLILDRRGIKRIERFDGRLISDGDLP